MKAKIQKFFRDNKFYVFGVNINRDGMQSKATVLTIANKSLHAKWFDVEERLVWKDYGTGDTRYYLNSMMMELTKNRTNADICGAKLEFETIEGSIKG